MMVASISLGNSPAALTSSVSKKMALLADLLSAKQGAEKQLMTVILFPVRN